jgi:chromatin structure-remodeling complex subunit RSC1/2
MTGNTNPPLPSPLANQNPAQPSYGQQFAQARPSASPAPLMHQNSYGSHGSGSHAAAPSTPMYQPQSTYNQYGPASTPVAQHPNPLANYNNYQSHSAPRPAAPASTSHGTPSNAYNPPRAVEVYTLPDSANALIPADIRSQFHRDEYGKVIFFTAPPLDVNPVPEEAQALGHSLRYLADKARKKEADEKKRKAREAELETAAHDRLKRMKTDQEGKKQWLLDQKIKAMNDWAMNMDKGTDDLYKQIHGENWKEMRELDLCKLAVAQEEALKKQKEIEAFKDAGKKKREVLITGFKWI